ncbi:hypothetical protein GCM10011391_30380 [Pullulanibacillus camelliae]|uniref:ABC transporter permease n=1 Tax=Pullulanibacillus camelliae TaxID=1707096 RepID=A0A8J2YKX6_9BACL|nr:ABC transporter permease [Pullulanibacillus camelliae]GGE49505.1 hypothetical protein GCM10011391_30380 [Pullulanibacillus camelliae]
MRGIHLLQNEISKIYKRKTFWIMLGILVAVTLLWAIIAMKTGSDHQNWQQSLQAQSQAEQSEIAKSDGDPEQVMDLKQQNAITKYRLEHSIKPLYSNTVMGFVDSSAGIASIISIFIVILGGSIVSQEYSWGTMKLLLIRPLHRWKILLSKFVSVIIIGIFYLLITFILSFIIGLIFFGKDFGATRFLYEHHNMVHDVSVFWHFLQLYASNLVDLIVITAFAFMLSTLFKSNALAIALSIAIYFGGSLILGIISAFNQQIPKYLFFFNMDLYGQYTNAGASPVDTTVGFSACVLAVYFILFLLIAFLVFEKRDVAE